MLTRSDDLEILITVVDSGSFSQAAEVMDVQVAKVSRAVSRLEQQLGITILNRTTRRLELTEEGKRFVESVRSGLQHLRQAEEDIVSRGELPKGKLRVDAASPFMLHQLVPLVREFHAAYPDIELELTSNEGYVDLLEKRTDVAIRIGKLNDSTCTPGRWVRARCMWWRHRIISPGADFQPRRRNCITTILSVLRRRAR